MTWDQAVPWLIVPAIVAIIVGCGGVGLLRSVDSCVG
jgi:hypothetical protein